MAKTATEPTTWLPSDRAQVTNVPIAINDVFPVAGTLQTFQIGSTVMDFPASPTANTFVAFTVPWTNTCRLFSTKAPRTC